ncbi:MAG: hypothetical protein WBG73_08260 [Coleofasciculaceae cyanobacterium]
MNSITDGYRQRLDFQDLELLSNQYSEVKLFSNGLSELFAQASNCGFLTRFDRYKLMMTLLESSLSDEEKAALDRLLYGVYRGRIRLIEDISAEFPGLELSHPQYEPSEPSMLLIRGSI